MRDKYLAELQAESVNNKKKHLHFKKLLRSGQTAHLWLYRLHRYYEINNGWGIALYIGDSDKEARLWATGKKQADITGTTSIEGLKWAMETVAWVANRLPVTHTLQIEGEDGRRSELYQRMINKQMKMFEQSDLRMCKVRYLISDEFSSQVVTIDEEEGVRVDDR